MHINCTRYTLLDVDKKTNKLTRFDVKAGSNVHSIMQSFSAIEKYFFCRSVPREERKVLTTKF